MGYLIALDSLNSSGFLQRYDRVHPPPSALIGTTVASIRCSAIRVEVRSLKSTACAKEPSMPLTPS